ncbi:MAG: DUF4124 domain-containing protein [Burkholderiales bacterium]
MVCAQTSGGTTVYKHVDEQGRVTYTNAPVRGAAQIKLQPITVVRSSPTAAASNAPLTSTRSSATNALSTELPSAAQTRDEKAPVPSFEQAQKAELGPTQSAGAPMLTDAAKEVAKLISASRPETPGAASAASTLPTAALVRQRRDEVRRRIIEGEIEAETQMLSDARLELQREQAKSPAMRSLRAALTTDLANTRASDKQLDQDTIIAKSLVERHFARIRDLQDVIAMHEANVAELRALLPAQSKTPVAKVVATRSVAVQR